MPQNSGEVIRCSRNLKDWSDFDGAQHAVAVCLGLMPNDWSWVLKKKVKGVFWTQNEVSDLLYGVLEGLVGLGVLEKNDDDQFRYNTQFVPPWEDAGSA